MNHLKNLDIQLRGNQKDFNFQLHHRMSKFEVPVVVNLKHIFELFGLYTTCFLIQKLLELIRLSSEGQFWRKGQNKKGGKFELRSQLCYYNCNYLHLHAFQSRGQMTPNACPGDPHRDHDHSRDDLHGNHAFGWKQCLHLGEPEVGPRGSDPRGPRGPLDSH